MIENSSIDLSSLTHHEFLCKPSLLHQYLNQLKDDERKVQAMFILYMQLVEEKIKIIDDEVENPHSFRIQRLLKLIEIIAQYIDIDVNYLL